MKFFPKTIKKIKDYFKRQEKDRRLDQQFKLAVLRYIEFEAASSRRYSSMHPAQEEVIRQAEETLWMLGAKIRPMRR